MCVKYKKNKGTERGSLTQTKGKRNLGENPLWGDYSGSGTSQEWQVTADTLTTIIRNSYITAVFSWDLSQKGIQTWILTLPMILCQYCFICLTSNSQVKAIFIINVLKMNIFWTTCCSEQFNLLTQTIQSSLEIEKANFWGENTTESAFFRRQDQFKSYSFVVALTKSSSVIILKCEKYFKNYHSW